MTTQFKNGSDIKKCLIQEKVLKLVVPAYNHTAQEKIVWEYCMQELMKTEQVIDGNLCNLFAVLMSLCTLIPKTKYKA